MHIPNSHNRSQLNSASHGETPEKLANQLGTTDSRGADSAHRADSAVAAKSSELGALTGQLIELPIIRNDVVAAAKQRLADGTYLSRDAAEQTANAILGSKATD